MSRDVLLLLTLVAFAEPLWGAVPAADPSPTPAAASVPRYTFSWPLEPAAPSPRGGSTRGAPVTPDSGESPDWQALHEPGLSAFERDRRAIRAIAGEYRVSFDFLEIAAYGAGAARDAPYQSWGTERVFVDRDDGKSISLVHILEMRLVGEDGKVGEPLVSKHWREDWHYEPRELVEFKGNERWERRDTSRAERRGQWSQTVDQVDESPRYSSVGHWEHSQSFSTWISGETWRPLPRRELSVRHDYQVLAGTNRVTVTPTGWIQEENNLKTVLTADRRPDAAQPYLAREYGVARYERLRDADFLAAQQYFDRTQHFWDEVHDAWSEVFRAHAQVTLHEPPASGGASGGAFGTLFGYADQLAHGTAPTLSVPEVIQKALREVGAPK